MPDSLSPDSIIEKALIDRRNGVVTKIELPGEMLVGIELRGADLTGANLQQADLSGADLAGARLTRANLQGASLVGAVLDGADLTEADLRGADLAGSRLDDTVLARVRLEGACLAAVMGDPLSFLEARLDRQTVELSEFTMRDIAQLVVRGAIVKEDETVPPSLAPRLKAAASRPLSSEVALGDGASETGMVVSDSAQPSAEAPVPSPSVLSPSSDAAARRLMSFALAPNPVSIRESEQGVGPPSDPKGEPEFAANKAPSIPSDLLPGVLPLPRLPTFDAPPLRSVKISERPAPIPSAYPSVIPMLRGAEVSARIKIAEHNQSVPHSMRAFQNLNALIEEARVQEAPKLSIQPALPQVRALNKSEFSFPEIGQEYLGVEIQELLAPGTSSRCFLGQDQNGAQVVVRIFDPTCDGAALQLPAFQRGLRALNRVQGASGIKITQLLCVATDQTAYVVKHYSGKSVKELLEATLTLEQGLDFVIGLSRNVAALHEKGVMVRAWRPANVLVDGRELVISQPDMMHLPTLAQYRGDVAGYGAYAAPEEILGQGTRSPTADVFSLGKMLEFLLTGQEPLVPIGSPPLIAQREHVPEVLVRIVTRATAPEPDERYALVSDLVEDLELFQKQGDQAALQARMRPAEARHLPVPALSTGPELPHIKEMLAQQRKRLEAIKAPPEPEEAPPSKSRQIEIGVGLLGALGGAAVLLLLILAPQSVDEMNALEPYLAVAIGLGALLAPRPDAAVVAFRIGSCAALASLVVLLHPVQLSKFTFERRLRSGAQVEDAVAQLARLGSRNYAAASLSGAKLSGLDLASADFSGADLSNANFDQGFLLESDFRGANVNGARFTGANLWGALLSDGGGWSEALCDSYTVMPIGWYCAKGTFAFDPTATEGESEENIEDNAPSPASSAAQKQGSADQVFGRPH